MITLQGRQLGRVKYIDTKPYSLDTKMAGQTYDRFAIGEKVLCINTNQKFNPKELFILELEETELGLRWIGDWSYQQERNLKSCLRDAAPATFSDLVTL